MVRRENRDSKARGRDIRQAAGNTGAAAPAHSRPPARLTVTFTPGQRELVKAIDAHTLTFAQGAAGTGKTFVAVHRALKALDDGLAERIIVARPAVEAGEKLGFLPGDSKEKLDPYLRPIYDVFYELGRGDLLKPSAKGEPGVVEICPLAFMRGRTFSSAFIILDEMQNATPEQFEMALTRTGIGSKVVVTYDPAQCDLRKPEAPVWATKLTSAVLELVQTAKGALRRSDGPVAPDAAQTDALQKEKRRPDIIRSIEIMKQIPGAAFVQLTAADNHRDPCVAAITTAFAAARGEVAGPTAPEDSTPEIPLPACYTAAAAKAAPRG